VVVPKGKLTLYIRWGFSSKLSDWDNPVKPFQDILQKEYEFDDRYIYLAIVEKIDVKKGDEFIEFKIKSHNEEDVMILLTKMEARLIEEVLEDIELMIDNGEDWIDEMSERVKDAKEIIHACNVYQETRPLFEEGETSE
jgi:DNA-binding Lrp family transcriptional regulator